MYYCNTMIAMQIFHPYIFCSLYNFITMFYVFPSFLSFFLFLHSSSISPRCWRNEVLQIAPMILMLKVIGQHKWKITWVICENREICLLSISVNCNVLLVWNGTSLTGEIKKYRNQCKLEIQEFLHKLMLLYLHNQ